MKRKSSIIGVVLLMFLIGGYWIYRTKMNTFFDKGTVVVKWDNWYQGNKIKFYYDDTSNSNIQELKSKNKLDEVVKDSKNDLDKALKLSKWLKSKVKYEKSSMDLDDDPLNIMAEALKGTKICGKDYTLLYSKLAESVGLRARSGELVKNVEESSKDIYHNVCEIWSNQDKKWIMIDVVNNVYMKQKNPLSACEIIEKGLNNVECINMNKKYKDDMEKYFYSYTISIDNTIYKEKKSNSYITFLKKDEIPRLQFKEEYINPTIFVNKQDLFNISPNQKYEELNEDKKGTFILSHKNIEGSKKQEPLFIVGVFKDSHMANNYYIKINDSKWKMINTYFDLKVTEGSETKIRLSLDGKNVEREVILKYVE